MRKLHSILITFTFLLFAMVAHAQGTANTSVQAGGGTGGSGGAGSGRGEGRSTAANEGMTGGVISTVVTTGFSSGFNVKNHPFSADTIDENDQFLADGNRIHRENHGKVFRDSEGRTRQEIELGHSAAGQPFLHVTIVDPVQGVFISLDPQNKTATVRQTGALAGASSGTAANESGKIVRKPATDSGKPTTLIAPPSAPNLALWKEFHGFCRWRRRSALFRMSILSSSGC